jgi:acid phosphatase type 7
MLGIYLLFGRNDFYCCTSMGSRASLTASLRLSIVAALISSVASHAAFADDPKMVKGPYLQDLAPSAMTIMWEMSPPSNATVEIDGPGSDGKAAPTRAIAVSKAPITEARITDLAPSSRYRYRVTVGAKSWSGEFATAPPIGSDSPFSFAAFGDSRQNAGAHRRVIERIAQDVPDFLLGTGDMVDDGAKQEQWQTFFDVEQALLKDNVYFPSIGNHDRQGRGRTADTYRAYFSVPDNGTDSERYYAFSYGNSRFLVLDSNSHSFSLTDQTAWIERELSAARQDPLVRHIFIVMHHPPFSISLHGGHRDLRERWTPLFEKYAVSAVLSGHDHVYERAEHNGIRYFVSGGGGAPLYPRSPKAKQIDKDNVLRFERAYNFLRVNVTASQIEVAAVRVDGTLIETTTWKDEPDKPVAPPALVASQHPTIDLTVAPPPSPAIGAPDPSARAATEENRNPSGVNTWAIAGGLLVLMATVVVVRALRR